MRLPAFLACVALASIVPSGVQAASPAGDDTGGPVAPQDGEKPPPPPPPPPPAPPKQDAAPAAAPADDPAAREILRKAADRQKADDFAKPGRLESFRVVVRKATFERTTTDAEGKSTKTTVETDTDGLVVDWKAGSIRTRFVIDGEPKVSAWIEPRKTGWIQSGADEPKTLTGAQYKTDADELQHRRTIVRRLLDVAFLAKMLEDGSRWRLLPDAAPYEHAVLLERIPPASAADAVALRVWIAKGDDGAIGDVIAARMPPPSPGEAAISFELTFHDAFPAVSEAKPGADPAPLPMRFPFRVDVFEQRDPAEKPRPVLTMFLKEVVLNGVDDDAFLPAR